MKKSITLILAALLLASLTGCDALRRIAGRPTAAEVEELRLEQIARREAEARQARLDSLERVQKAYEDSVAQAIAARTENGEARASKGLFAGDFGHKYAIVLGAFGQASNADALAAKARAAGYEADVRPTRNGFHAVIACPTDSERQAFQNLDRLKAEDFCPQDAWILMNE